MDVRTRLELHPDRLRRRLDPASLPFETTAEVPPLEGTIGQPRALGAIDFGVRIQTAGYNLFAAGLPGSGRETTLRDHLGRVAADRPVPDDWVYVFNFDAHDHPIAIRLPPGRAGELQRDMEELLTTARREIPRALESEEYVRRREHALAEVAARREALTAELQRFARARGFALEITPVGIMSMPLVDGRPLSPERLPRLTPEQRKDLERRNEEVGERGRAALRELRRLDKEAAARVRELTREVALFTLAPPLAELREKYAELPDVLRHLDAVQQDIPDHLDEFAPGEDREEMGPLTRLLMTDRDGALGRYRVNVLVDNARTRGAPVVIERNPTYYNLLGRLQYRPALGTMVTDFHQLRAGALHRANGGFLVIDALHLLAEPFAWEALKRAIRSREIRIENLAEQYTPIPAATIRAQPVPLDVKVVLIGSPLLYYLLSALDEDFRELFKVKVDFSPEMAWSDEHVGDYAAFISRSVARSGLRHFDREGVARVVEHGARLREDQRKLSTRLLEISDVVSEASFWAGEAGRELVRGEDVARAIRERDLRSNQLEERVHELIADGTIMIETAGERTGQINGLSLIDLGDYVFCRPSRVTARVALGKGSIESIERQIELSGPIHSKGVLTLSGYIAETYGQEWPLALRATITFEQAYEEVEGDSASSAELYALLSALSGLPIRQGMAVTGSVDQHGRVQAVGGVTRKVEGFHAVCRAKGLTGEQGVVIPSTNEPHLMLSDDVVESARAGRFHLWRVETVDEGIELLTGRPAGRRGPDGAFPEGSVHALVEARLRGYAERLRSFAVSLDGGERAPRARAPASGPEPPAGRPG